MTDGDGISPKDFGSLFKGFLEEAMSAAPREEPFFRQKLHAHFDEDPSKLPTVSENIDPADHPNLQRAIDAYLGASDRTAELVGILGGEDFRGLSIAGLLSRNVQRDDAKEGPVEYTNIALADGDVLPCVGRGLYLIVDGKSRFALLVSGPDSIRPWARPRIDVMARGRLDAVALLAELRTAMRTRNVYRGQVITLGVDEHRQITVHFHRLRNIERNDIILPEGLLERIELQTIGFSTHREALLAAGRHLKRGLLLYGPPGTGKTLTAMYIAGQMKERTTFLLTGRGLSLIESSCEMARLLQPSTVILEDVDLVAKERRRQSQDCTTVLFELLNEMDGLADDADILFILTTNQPEILEPALASRPGRVDLAIEVPLPDATCRRRLLDLYGRGLRMEPRDPDRLIQQIEGVSAAFIRELLRKATLFAATRSKKGVVSDEEIDAALHELVVQGGSLTRSLLGAQRNRAD